MGTRGVWDDSYLQPTDFLNDFQYTAISQASGSILAANFAGSAETELSQSGATALTTPTAAAIFGLITSLVPLFPASGCPYRLRVINTNAGLLTLTAGTGVTINGTATVAIGAWREYLVQVNGPNSVTMQSLGAGDI